MTILTTDIATISISNEAELKKYSSEIAKSERGVYLVINEIEEIDVELYNDEDLIQIDSAIFVIEEATKGDTVDSITGAGLYLAKGELKRLKLTY